MRAHDAHIVIKSKTKLDEAFIIVTSWVTLSLQSLYYTTFVQSKKYECKLKYPECTENHSLFQSKVRFLLVEKQKTSYGWQSYDLYNKHLSTAAENLTSKTAKNSERGVGRKNILEENYENNAIHISEKQSKNVFSSEINSCIPSSLRFFLQRVSFLEAANNRLMDWKPNS